MMVRKQQPTLLPTWALALLCTAFVLVSGCKPPPYPGCKKDDHCASRSPDGSAYCVNGQCQQCRTETDCDAGSICNAGRCEQESECPCPDNQYCEDLRCIDKCESDDSCGQGLICAEGGRCIPGCATDIECGEGMKCVDQQCQVSAIPQACQDAAGSLQLSLINFDFNTAELTFNARTTLEQNAECLGYLNGKTLLLEGHCDERGTQEYNLALGENRAQAVKRFLTNLGVNSANIQTISKGKNEQVCYQNSESCHSRNRRVEFIVQ